MRLHRFIGDFDLSGEDVTLRDSGLLHQITRVLRLSEGDELVLADGAGAEARGTIRAISDASATVALTERHQNTAEPARRVTLYLALLRRDNFEWAVQKAVEVGAKRIVPLAAERSVKHGFKRERVQKIAHEAAEQSGRGRVPEIAEPVAFSEALHEASGTILFFDTGGASLQAEHLAPDELSVFIGAEGGWSEAERATARDAGITGHSLGALVLRAETAAVVATYRAAIGI